MMTDRVDGKPYCDDRDAVAERAGFGSGDASAPTPTMDLSEFDSDSYNMNHKERGVALIFNQKEFDPKTKMKTRQGTDVDASRMNDLFNTLRFEEIKQYNDRTVQEIKTFMEEAADKDYTEMDCFACVILSHGDEGYIYGKDDRVQIDDLIAPFKGNRCKSLAGKPKIFFIQACRGTSEDDGVTVHDAESGEEAEEKEERIIPVEADFLLAYSTVPGYYSWRNSKKGSWFIQGLVDVFNNNWEELDLLTMMTRVNKKVAFDFESSNTKKKQIPCITSMLTKDVFFSKRN